MTFEGTVHRLTSKAGRRNQCSQLNRARSTTGSSSGCAGREYLGFSGGLMHCDVVTGDNGEVGGGGTAQIDK